MEPKDYPVEMKVVVSKVDVEVCRCHHEVGLVEVEARGSVAKQG